MDDNIQKITNVINIIRSLCPRVDQYGTICQPLAICVNELCDVRDALQKPAENPEEPNE